MKTLLSTTAISIWFKGIKCMQQDVHFIEALLKSNIYGTRIPNLFEELELFKRLISSLEGKLHAFMNEVEAFRNSIECISEEDGYRIEDHCYTRHKYLDRVYQDLESDFKEGRYRIFRYLENVLVKR